MVCANTTVSLFLTSNAGVSEVGSLFKMASTSSNDQPSNGNWDHDSSFPKAPPKKHVLEYLRSRAPSEEMRERRRRCFIASSFTKCSADKNMVVDESKSRRFTFAMREDEEIDFFRSLWNSLTLTGSGGDVATTRPTSTETPVAMESCKNMEDGSFKSNRTSAEMKRCKGFEPRSVDLNANPVAGLSGRQRCALDDGQAPNAEESIFTLLSENVNVVNIQGKGVDPLMNGSIGLNEDNGFTQTEGGNGEAAIEIKVGPEVDAKKTSGDYSSDVSAPGQRSSKQKGNISDSVESPGPVNTNVGVAGVPSRPIEAEIILDDESTEECVLVHICPPQNSVLSQTDLCLEENLFPDRMGNEMSYIGRVTQRNVFTQTAPQLDCNIRNKRDLSCGRMGANGKPQRNWYRYNGNRKGRLVDRNIHQERRSHNCHNEQRSRVHRPKVSADDQRSRPEHRKEFTQTDSNLRDSRNRSRQPHEADETAVVDCNCSCSCSSCSSVNDVSTRDCSRSSNYEKSSRRRQEKKARSVFTKTDVKRRTSFATGKPFGRTPTPGRQASWPSCRCSDDATASRGRRKMADVDPLRHVLLCSTCGVVVTSEKKMRAHLNGGRHSRAADDAERRCAGENPNRVIVAPRSVVSIIC